jgi:uncharacterized damage-inducible protein DinB
LTRRRSLRERGQCRLERWLGRAPVAHLRADAFDVVPSVRARWESVARERGSWLDGLRDDDLARPLAYVNMQGQAKRPTVAATLYHVANHATYHRGQVTTLLRQLGAVPLCTDYVLYQDGLLERDGARRGTTL